MSIEFSRTYLQSLPAAARKAEFDQLFRTFIGEVAQAARAGKTSYVFSMQLVGPTGRPPGGTWTADELLPLFKEKFPDCTVHYEEMWIDVTSTSRHFSKRIVIDWS